jgi:hypothetical protein
MSGTRKRKKERCICADFEIQQKQIGDLRMENGEWRMENGE